jgi:hypothetical protein
MWTVIVSIVCLLSFSLSPGQSIVQAAIHHDVKSDAVERYFRFWSPVRIGAAISTFVVAAATEIWFGEYFLIPLAAGVFFLLFRDLAAAHESARRARAAMLQNQANPGSSSA